MRSLVVRLSSLAAIAMLAACANDTTNPISPNHAAPAAPSHLVAPGQSFNTLVDSVDTAGNHLIVDEWAAGILPDGSSVASVTIRTFIPATSGTKSSDVCITSTVVSTETTPGWSATIKKSGGCNKEIEVELENGTTNQKADFRFQMEPGKTRVDLGAVN